jgi:hypothetical protein
MLPPDKQRELARFLSSLPPSKALKLAAAAERKRIAGESGLPFDAILDSLRPVLAEQEALRTPSPQRLFCEVFADFLVDDREHKQPGRIARASVRALWRWLESEGMPTRLPELEAHIADAVLAENIQRQDDLLERLRHEVLLCLHDALSRANENRNERLALAAKFRSEETLIDIEEMAFLLATAQDLLPLRELLPRRIANLTDEHIKHVLDARARVSARNRDLVPYMGLLLLARLDQPWQALRLTGTGRRGRPDLNAVGDILVADLEHLALDIASTQAATFDPELLAARLAKFNRLCAGLGDEIRARHGEQWGQALTRLRQLADATVEGLVAQAPRQIAAALPLVKSSPFSLRRQRQPDLSREPDPMKFDNAERWALFLACVAPHTEGSGYQSAHKKAFDAVSSYLSAYAECAAAELRSPDIATHARVQAYLAYANELLNTIIRVSDDEKADQRAAV